MQASLTGIVGQASSATNNIPLRSIEVKTYVWDAIRKSIAFTVTCLFPNTPRWQNTSTPRRGALIHVTGEIIGQREGSNQIAMMIQAFSYIDVRGTEMATNASMERSLQSSPGAPRRTRWMAWQSRSDGANNSASITSAGKKRAHEAVDLDENVATENRAAGKRRAHEALD